METYELHVAGVKRQLPVIPVNNDTKIASFVILGDTQLVAAAAEKIIPHLPEVDLLVTAEAKGIPFVHELSKQLNMDRYIVARKSVKPYMHSPLVHEVTSITTQEKQTLCLSDEDAAHINHKRIALIDDVISSGGSIQALEEIVSKAGGTISAKAAILAEGEAAERKDITYLERLPVFTKENNS
ncbi:phosphoribosyltransferase family protein [Lentibacillus halophilus]|uniref:Phosphoribosyltransferase family protein n=1 Tax=Lentibacillus halophilus TaxID=295065 RepID=A0ABP3JAD9_9BACI